MIWPLPVLRIWPARMMLPPSGERSSTTMAPRAASKCALTGTASVPKLHAGHRVRRRRRSAARSRRDEGVIDVQLDVLRAALDQAVDVEEARGDGDRALGQDARALRVDRGVEADVDRGDAIGRRPITPEALAYACWL